MPRWLRISLIVAAVVLVLVQFVPVDRSNPPEPAPLDAPPAVLAVLDQSCSDCHSHRTAWPWYARIAPVSWLVAHDVHEAREHLNFSVWGRLSDAEGSDLRGEMWEEVSEGEMPLDIYLWLHRDAALTEADLAILAEWTGGPAGVERGEHDHEGDEH
jgi:hypothetical protein